MYQKKANIKFWTPNGGEEIHFITEHIQNLVLLI